MSRQLFIIRRGENIIHTHGCTRSIRSFQLHTGVEQNGYQRHHPAFPLMKSNLEGFQGSKFVVVLSLLWVHVAFTCKPNCWSSAHALVLRRCESVHLFCHSLPDAFLCSLDAPANHFFQLSIFSTRLFYVDDFINWDNAERLSEHIMQAIYSKELFISFQLGESKISKHGHPVCEVQSCTCFQSL